MSTSQQRELAAYVLEYGKRLAPDRFPQASAEVVDAWSDVLGAIPLPAQVWPEAVRVWALELVGDRMCTPRDLKRAAFIVRDRWESDPVRKCELREYRQQRQELRDRQLAEGTFGQARGYKPLEIEGVGDVDVDEIVERIKRGLRGD
ncbi:hypothetical protein ACL1FX_07615 [Corynebacterium striatum]